MVTASVSITRAGLSLSPLVISNAPLTSGLFLAEEGFSEPIFEVVHAAAPDSAYQSGRVLLSWRVDQAPLPFNVYAAGASSAAVATLKAELNAALMQYGHTITQTVDGVAATFTTCWPFRPQWGAIDSGMVRGHLARATCAPPVNPA